MSKLPNAALSTIQNLSAPLAEIAVRFQMVSPEWTLAIGMGAGLLAVYRELAENRGKELLDYIYEYKTEFSDTVIKTPEFKATFLNIWEKHIRENSEIKRKRLRKFLLKLGTGEKIDTDLHSKIYSVIEQMTEREAEIYGIIFENSNRDQFAKMHLNTSSIPGLVNYPENMIQDVCHSLHSYRLINTSDATIGAIMLIKQITPFGELFYDYILREE